MPRSTRPRKSRLWSRLTRARSSSSTPGPFGGWGRSLYRLRIPRGIPRAQANLHRHCNRETPHLARIRQDLRQGADLNTPTSRMGRSPFQCAFLHCKEPRWLDALVAWGADPLALTAAGQSCGHLAASRGNAPAYFHWVDRMGGDPLSSACGFTPIDLAAGCDVDIDFLSRMLEALPAPDRRRCLRGAFSRMPSAFNVISFWSFGALQNWMKLGALPRDLRRAAKRLRPALERAHDSSSLELIDRILQEDRARVERLLLERSARRQSSSPARRAKAL